ncbi:MAG: helicase-related protein [Eubacteriales bacterium]
MKTGESDKKLRARLFTELVKEQKVDPSHMTTAQWMDLYAELGRRVAAEKASQALKTPTGEESAVPDWDEAKRQSKLAILRVRELPDDFVNPWLNDPRLSGVWFDYLPDALDFCLSCIGRVDILLISLITGKSPAEVIDGLRGRIYQDPGLWEECFYRGFVSAEEYLTGNLNTKLTLARRADSYYDGWFSDQVRALEAALPSGQTPDGIYVGLGSPFVMPWIIDQFICYMLGGRLYSLTEPDYIPSEYRTVYDSASATWYIPEKGRYRHSSRSTRVWGTPRMEALHILERTLNGRVPQVFDETSAGRAVNRSETLLACEKQRLMRQAFSDWVWKDEHRANLLQKAYQERFCRIVPRRFDGSRLTLPDLSENARLYPYQKDAVARMLASRNVLLAHDVGSGKTYEMVAAAVEMKRMGIAAKPMFVVPNHIVGQWEDIFKLMKPDAVLLVVDPKNFTPKKRESLLIRAKEGEFDGIIVPYSCFEQIPLSPECRREGLSAELDKLSEQIRRCPKVSARVRSRERRLREQIPELDRMIRSETSPVGFDELGVDALFVDEAHNFKNYPIDTKCEGLLGINRNGSAKCVDLMEKVRLIQKAGGRVVFATGTPITNSVSDMYIMQSYLQNDELERLGIAHFDAWTGMFAEKTADFEIDVTTRSYRLTSRFGAFHNLPELTNLFGMIADFHSMEHSDDLPLFEGYSDVYQEKSERLSEYLITLSDRADGVRSGSVARSVDNLLKITTDGRKAALDLRLVDPTAPFDPSCKAALCARRAAEIFHSGEKERLTQLIFCDSSVPKASFNLYDELRRLLILQGVPENQIAFVHDYESDKERETLFSAVNEGSIRILLGSTQKLGIGVNVQERLAAIHHLDLPWRPADLTQREGRILRQGNRNARVQIFRYITVGSFDAYSWQLLETKQKFICALLSGSVQSRDGEDVDSVVLDYAEIKALSLGNPLLRKRAEASSEIYRLTSLQRGWQENRRKCEKAAAELPGKIDSLREQVSHVVHDIAGLSDSPPSGGENAKHIGEVILTALSGWIGENTERELTGYRGFTLILPAGMTKEKPYLWVQGSERYYVEAGNTPIGMIRRLDRRLSTLTEVLIEFNRRLEQSEQELAELNAILEKPDPYAERLTQLEERLRAIDRRLGLVKPG